jgi:C-terminal processing protease CtpA/Prc
LIDGSPAATAGLKKGDRITAIDGVAAKHLVRHDILMTFTRPAGTAVHLTYERDGKSAEATLVLKTLLP